VHPEFYPGIVIATEPDDFPACRPRAPKAIQVRVLGGWGRRLLDRLADALGGRVVDAAIVTKLDRLGRNAMGVLIAVAEFERDLLIERTHAGIARARAEGKVMGRPSALTNAQQAQALQRLAAGESVSQLARDYGTTRQSIMRLRNKAASA
jgi:putative DNA-invertase from lambdoid prophage Rac